VGVVVVYDRLLLLLLSETQQGTWKNTQEKSIAKAETCLETNRKSA
jgi:hypothetical protein